MAAVIRIIERADSSDSPEAGQYVVVFDHDAHAGRGTGMFSRDVAHALRFNTKADAIEFWNRASRLRPLRPDGEPNKPMTAYTVEIEEVA
jgi:hypothetical protein